MAMAEQDMVEVVRYALKKSYGKYRPTGEDLFEAVKEQLAHDDDGIAYDMYTKIRKRLETGMVGEMELILESIGEELVDKPIHKLTAEDKAYINAKIARGFYDNFTADNLYASDPSRDRGDYAESGLYRPDEQGQTWNSRSKQYGGDINFGEDPDYVEGDEVYMTDDEIRQYMANGGQVEYL
jgi:hypothetical protein